MAVTQEDIDSLESAIKAGTKTFTIGDMSITYRDLNEMRLILSSMKEQLNDVKTPFSVVQVSYTRGD